MVRISLWELANHLNSWRVLAMALLLLILFPVIVGLRVGSYVQSVDDCRTRQQAQQRCLERFAHWNRLGAMTSAIVPPERLEALLVRPPLDARISESNQGKTLEGDALRALIDEVGLEFLLSFALGPWLLLVAAAGAAGDRRAGRLVQVAALPVGRAELVVGRIGGTVLLGVVLLTVGLGLSLALLAGHPGVRLGWVDLAGIGGIYVAGVLYLVFMTSLGHLLGTLFRRPGSATLAALTVWVLMDVVVPLVAPLGVERAHGIPPVSEVRARMDEVERQRLAALRRAEEPYRGLPQKERWERARGDSINQVFFARRRAIWGEYDRACSVHDRLSWLAASVSPGAACRIAAWELGGVGRARLKHVGKVLDLWKDRAREYLLAKIEKARDSEDLFDASDIPPVPQVPVPLGLRLSYAWLALVWLAVLAAGAVAAAAWLGARTDPRPSG